KARYGLAGDQLPDLSLLDRVDALDAILVTHAHTDHTGALELVTARYPDTPVFATPPTIALTRVLHQDSRRIMRTRLEEEGELPLFDDVAVSRLISAFVQVPFNSRLPLGAGLVAVFYPAGHIAGAAMISLESDEGRVLFSGDLSFSPQRTVGSAKLPPLEPDVLILESTYGGRLHANRAVQERRMVEVVQEITQAGGKVLIPAFALGRAQEILLILSEFQRQGRLVQVPIWADGMVRAICQVYSSFSDLLPLSLQEQNASFFTGSIRPVQTNEQRNALVWQSDPAVIVSSSGMLAGGPSLSYARALAGQPQHAILLTGYQDEEAPGRRLQEMAERGRGTLWLGKDKVDVQCRLGTYSLSAHADEGQLLSMVETLNPAHVILVHGDESARTSFTQALEERKRIVHIPQAGQSLQFSFAPTTPASKKVPASIRSPQTPVIVRDLWKTVAETTGGYFQIDELARAWWGNDFAQTGLDRLAAALAEDDLYFTPDPRRPELFRARPPEQIDVILQRRSRMIELAHLPGQWVSLRGAGNESRLVCCISLAREYFEVENDEGGIERAWPEDLLVVYGADKPEKTGVLLPGSGPLSGFMEPNQALVLANSAFPPAARLRKAGYRLNDHVLTLTFDFPDVARERFVDQISGLEEASAWRVEITPEANQGALFALVRELLPSDCQIIKGPALYRQNRQVAATISGLPTGESRSLAAAQERFRQESGFDLNISFAQASPTPLPKLVSAAAASPLEINAAYAVIKSALAGSTLYRTSLKGAEIMLSFISAQVGQRYQAEIGALSRQVGWLLVINPQPNQGAILEAAQMILSKAGIAILKGPGIYPERAEVVVAIANPPEEDQLADLLITFEEQTGFRLVLNSTTPAASLIGGPARQPLPEQVISIPTARIRLRRF
ncbi:MAG: MBL fold metallo-hydrolase, partial [Anaerolineaceae bacterium]|nr:MBL fold metallo-hydrolase [Anaerolineaceae bacterium]